MISKTKFFVTKMEEKKAQEQAQTQPPVDQSMSKNKFCTECGAALKEDSKICTECGKKLK